MEENNQNKEPLNKDFKVPKLRFLRFKNDWQTAKLSDLFSVGMCKRIFSNQTSDTGEVPFYKIGTLGRIPDSYISKELFHEYKSKYRFPNIGETLISCSGTIGRCIKYDGKDAYFQDSNIVWLINDQRVILNDFLFYLIARYDWGFLNTTTIKRLFIKDLNNLTINYPQDQREQKHIVNLINTLSMKIRNIEDKINILKKYRKGIINSWFKNIGKAVRLCELVKQQTSQLLTHQIKDNIGTYPVYDATGNIYKSIDFYTNANDSIAIIKYGSGCGRTFIARDKHCVLGTMSELIPLINGDLTYIFAFTESSKFKKICKKYIEVGTTPNLYYSDYSTELVYYPDERNNFVELIDLISKKCVCLETEKEELDLLKRQLLKDMFI